MPIRTRLVALLFVIAAIAVAAFAGERGTPRFGARFGTYIAPPGPAGSLFLAGDGAPPDRLIEAFFERAGGGPLRIIQVGTSAPPSAYFARRVRDAPTIIRTRDEADADAWGTGLDQVAGIWIEAGEAETAARLCENTTLHRALERLVARGGTIGAAGAAATAPGAILPSSGQRGLGLLPGSIVAADAPTRETIHRVRATVDAHPDHVGLAIDRATALVTVGRRGAIIGRSAIVVTLAGTDARPPRTERMLAGTTINLITLSRAAVARAQAPFPPARPGVPATTGGTLFMGGGGRLTSDVVRRFIAAAGGPTAPIVVIPTALGPRSNQGASDVQAFRAAGARDVSVVHAPNAQSAQRPSTLNPLRRARGIWFSGGRQWRLVDSYLDTLAHQLMHGVLARGGAIGGGSAGASIQAEYMVRGHPLDNRIVMAEGYERGLGFLPGTAIDQHFTQRGRPPDMAKLKSAYPQLLGIGIDEDTTAIVRGRVLEVAGPHRVLIYDGDGRTPPTKRTVLRGGDRYDLAAPQAAPTDATIIR